MCLNGSQQNERENQEDHHQQPPQPQQLAQPFQTKLQPSNSNSSLVECNSLSETQTQLPQLKLCKSEWNNLPQLALQKIFKLLERCDRISASSTCKRWRASLYHKNTWASPSMRVNLCSHKFKKHSNVNHHEALPLSQQHHQQDKVQLQSIAEQFLEPNQLHKSGIHIFKHESLPHEQRASQQNRALKRLLRNCDRFLVSLTLIFDPNSVSNVVDLIQILRHLGQNSSPRFSLATQSWQRHSNCRNLRHLALAPICPLTKTVHLMRFVELYHELFEQFANTLTKCQSLESLSFGNVHELAACFGNELLAQIPRSTRTLRRLDLCTIKGDPFSYLVVPLKPRLLQNFSSLQHLSVDFDSLTNEFVRQIATLCQLQTLTVNVHRFAYSHSGVSHDAIQVLLQNCPKLRNFTLNLLHIDAVHLRIVEESLLNSELPLSTLRAYYLDLRESQWELVYSMLDLVSRKHCKTLESLVLVDDIRRPKRCFQFSNINALVMFAWMCRQLHYMTVIGYELPSVDVIAIARLRGSALRNLYIPESCIDFQLESQQQFQLFLNQTPFWLNKNIRAQHYEQFLLDFEAQLVNYFNECVSHALQRVWHPLGMQEIPEKFLSTYHRTILEQMHNL